VVEKLLAQRNLSAPPGLADWLVPRIDRTYVGLIRVVDALDDVALAKRARLSIRLARGTLASLGMRSEGVDGL